MALVASLPLLVAAFLKKLYHEDPEKAGAGQVKKTADAPAGPGADAKPSQMVETPEGNEIKPARRDPEIKGEPAPKLWALSLLAFVLFFLGMAMVKPYRTHLTPFGSSLLVMLTFVWAGACVALSIRYTEFLFKKAHDTPVRQRDQALPWFLWLSALLAVGLGLFSVGAVIAWRVFSHVQDRVDVWLHPFDDPQGKGFKIVEATFGLAWGGIVRSSRCTPSAALAISSCSRSWTSSSSAAAPSCTAA
jgi:hypothetical protein